MAEKEFTCVIEDIYRNDRFSAKVSVNKKRVIRATWQKERFERTYPQKDRIELADIYITPVSDQLKDVHNHFILYDYTGHGVYIVRDRYGNREDRRECSIWDLGHSFAIQVMEGLKDFA